MPVTEEWNVNSGKPVDGISTNARKLTVRNFGAPVGIRVNGRRLDDQEPGDKTYSLPGRDVLFEVLFLELSASGLFELESLSGFLAADTERGHAEQAQAMVLMPDELEVMGAAAQAPIKGGGVLTVRIFLEVEGFGSFTAGILNTANGIASAWVGAGVTLPLTATAAPGWQFSHWLVNGLFGGSSPKHHVAARPLLKIRAVFAKAASQAVAPSEAA